MRWYKLFDSYSPRCKRNPILGAALSTVGSLASSMFSQSAQEEQNEENKKWQEKMWNKTNEYNSPKHQRELLQEGGYNPYIYGNDSMTSGASNPSTPASNPLPGIKNPMDAAMSSYTSMRSIEQRDTELALKQQELENNRELSHTKSLESITDQLIKAYKEGDQDLYDKTFELLKPQMEKYDWSNSHSAQLFNEDIMKRRLENDRSKLELEFRQKYGDKESQAKLNELDAITKKYRAEYAELMSRKDLNRKEIEALGARMARDMAEAGLLNSKSGEIQSLLPYTRSIFEDDSVRSDMDRQNKETEFESEEDLRKFKTTPWNKREKKIEYTSKHNPVTDFIRGFTEAVPISPLNPSGTSETSKYMFGGK